MGVYCGVSHIHHQDMLILFAKSPYASNVKTRLSPLLSRKERACLQEAFILDTLSLTASLDARRALFFPPDTKDRFFAQCEKEHSVLLVKQAGDDLGERMRNGFCWAFSHGAERVVMMGSDSPTLPASFIQEAFRQLKTAPIVLGPAIDGGYYLIGARSPLPNIFGNIKWGSSAVLSDTLARLSRFYLLPFWYDVDYPKDVDFLGRHISLLAKQGGALPVATFKAMSQWKKK